MAGTIIRPVKAERMPEKLRIAVRFPYSQTDVAMVKEVPGAYWSKPNSYWTLPLTMTSCKKLRHVFGERLELGPHLRQWGWERRNIDEVLAQLTHTKDLRLNHLPTTMPRLAAALRPDQRVAAQWLAQAIDSPYHGGLVADKPGLGKTLEVIAGLGENPEHLVGAHLIVCPRVSVSRVWHREITRWTDFPSYRTRGKGIANDRKTRERIIAEFIQDPSPTKFLIVNAEMARCPEIKVCKRKDCDFPFNPDDEERHIADDHYAPLVPVLDRAEYPALFKQIKWKTVVADESHKYLGSLAVAKRNLAGAGLVNLPLAEGGARIAATGTPFGKGGRVKGMFGTLHWICPTEYSSFWRWANEFLEVDEDDYGHKKVGGYKAENEEDFFASIGPMLIRRTKEEVLPNLPPKTYVEVLCELVGKQKKQYIEFMNKNETEVEGGTLVGMGVLSMLTRCKQIANCEQEITYDDNGEMILRPKRGGDSGKLEQLWQIGLEENGHLDGEEGDTKILVISQSTKFLDEIGYRLKEDKVRYYRIDGSVSDNRREEQMEDFQENPDSPKVFLLQTDAAGISITLDAADQVHMMDEKWNPEENEQAEDRAHRASRMHNVTIFYYRTQDTIDTFIQEQVAHKEEIQKTVLDRRRGVDIVKEIVRRGRAA
jgi:SNF2 family DNA or RNA helicase